jgi:hypothetical protein
VSEFIEDEQIGFELPDFVFDFLFVELALAANGFEEGALGPLETGGAVALLAGADGFVDDPAVDPAGTRVTASVFGEGYE